ncbi:MAG: outer membrane protein assembly factor BamD [Candidatus Cloacimonadaceae bacterium]|nr:outer membrane protein assembly factor BamD [Candidatus Cloacimonadaceae bacterium]MDP3113746.1 outer membrane protein assembly factor BamD [Candidatus Cloacimonadaceae bacterium]
MRHYILITIVILLLIAGCAKNRSIMTGQEKLALADELFANKKFARAAELYGDVYFERTTVSTAYALMRQADSYFKINKFADARIAYLEFTDAFPQHQDVRTAFFKIGLCYLQESHSSEYDQTETLAGIEAFRTFISKYPNDERFQEALSQIRKAQYKLIEKRYRNGYIYFKMKDYSAALMYFDEVVNLGNTDSLDRQSLYYSALLHLKQNNHGAARTSFQTLQNKYPGSKETKKLLKRFK